MAQLSPEVKIRPLVEADLPRVNEIDRMLFGEQRVPTWPFSFEIYWKIHRPQLSLVAEVSGRVVGFIVGTVVEEGHTQSVLDLRHGIDRPTHHRLVGWMDMIGIDPDSQRMGIGQSLVNAFATECRHMGATAKGVARESDSRLRKFLSSAGFKPTDLVEYQME